MISRLSGALKRVAFFLIAVCSIGFSSVALAQAGAVLATAGGNHIERGPDILNPLQPGQAVQPGDVIVTDSSGRLQIRFADGAIVSMQPGSRFRVDEYRFEEEKPNSFFSLLRGAVRMASGLIGKKDPDQFRLSTPSATIGIRGTHFVVEHTVCNPDCYPASKAGTRVAVTRGKVVMRNAGGSVLLSANQSAWVGDQNATPQRDNWTPDFAPRSLPIPATTPGTPSSTNPTPSGSDSMDNKPPKPNENAPRSDSTPSNPGDDRAGGGAIELRSPTSQQATRPWPNLAGQNPSDRQSRDAQQEPEPAQSDTEWTGLPEDAQAISPAPGDDVLAIADPWSNWDNRNWHDSQQDAENSGEAPSAGSAPQTGLTDEGHDDGSDPDQGGSNSGNDLADGNGSSNSTGGGQNSDENAGNDNNAGTPADRELADNNAPSDPGEPVVTVPPLGDPTPPPSTGATVASNWLIDLQPMPQLVQQGLLADPQSTVIFDNAITLESVGRCDGGLCINRGSAQVVDAGHDEYAAWGRWTNGQMQVRVFGLAHPVNLSANEGLHYVVGSPTMTIPASGSFTYQLTAATAPTMSHDWYSPGQFSGTAAVQFAPGAAPRVGLDARVDLADDQFTFSTTGGAADPSQSQLSLDANQRFSGQLDANGGHESLPWMCGSVGCKAQVEGALFGPTGERLGVSYSIQSESGSTRINGVGIFNRP